MKKIVKIFEIKKKEINHVYIMHRIVYCNQSTATQMENDASQHNLFFSWLRGVDMNMCVSTSLFQMHLPLRSCLSQVKGYSPFSNIF